jgi:1-phosphofructokinase/tagatose 6-phosphate kinase
MILTITLNPALDRTMTVPNFQAGYRHRATDTVVLPGGKGINVARVVKTLGRPVIATGFLGGGRGEQILGNLNAEGILCDFVRIRGESRTSTAVVDPTNNTITEINEMGPEIRPEELALMMDKLEYLGKAADIAILGGTLPRALDDGVYMEMIQRLKRLGLTVFFYTYTEPLRLGIKAGPDFIFPKQVDAEGLIGYEFNGVDDMLHAVRRMREMGSGSAVISYRYGCVAELMDGNTPRTFVAKLPPREMVSPVGWGDALVGGYAVRLAEGDGPEECLRFGLGCAAANLGHFGAGVFSPKDAIELARIVEIEEVHSEG